MTLALKFNSVLEIVVIKLSGAVYELSCRQMKNDADNTTAVRLLPRAVLNQSSNTAHFSRSVWNVLGCLRELLM